MSDNVTEINLNIFGSKIRKVSRCRPAVLNKTILENSQNFFFTKEAPLQSITKLQSFSSEWLFHSALLFFRKKVYFFECLYFIVYDIRMSLYFYWLRKEPSIKYARN